MGKPSRDKGKVGERELAKELSRLFGVDARRGVQYQGGPGSPDVVGLPGVHVECKRNEALQLYSAIEQAITDSRGFGAPLVCHRRNGKPWLAIVRLDDLPRLVEKLYLILAENA